MHRLTTRFATPVFAVVSAALLTTVFSVLPIVYETVDDPVMALILQGEKALQLAPDPHALFVHYLLGWFVSSLSSMFEGVAWYGVLMALLYAVAYTVVGIHLLQIRNGERPGRKIWIYVAFLAAFGLLPLILMQFTVLAALLALAAVLPFLRYVVLHQSSDKTMWVVSALCAVMALLVRPEMAIAVIAVCVPACAVTFYWDRDWRRPLPFFAFAGAALILMVGLRYTNDSSNRISPPFERQMEFNRMLAFYVQYTSGRSFQRDLYASAGWSSNDFEMFSTFMGLDTGPFSLENVKRVERARLNGADSIAVHPTVHPGSVEQANADTPDRKLWIVGKFERLVNNRYGKDVLRASYLLVVLGAGFLLTAAMVVLREWKRACVMIAMGTAVAGFYGIVTIVIDRPVFRVLFSMAYVFFVIAATIFPWRRLAEFPSLPRVTRGSLLAAATFGCLIGGLGVVTGVAQAYSNREQQSRFLDYLRRNLAVAAAGQAVIAWPDAYPVQYLSPFVRDGFLAVENGAGARFYQFNSTWGSHPYRLKMLKADFGDDVYQNLTGPGVVHLVSAKEQVTKLETFYDEHYGRKVRGVQREEFVVGDVTITSWTLLPYRESSVE